MVEHHVANVDVAGSNPVSCSRFLEAPPAACAGGAFVLQGVLVGRSRIEPLGAAKVGEFDVHPWHRVSVGLAGTMELERPNAPRWARRHGLLRPGSIVVAANTGDLFSPEVYLRYVRSFGRYDSESREARIEYSDLPDAVEISVYRCPVASWPSASSRPGSAGG